MEDRFGRKIEYLRISITDRCNLRCRYCMPDGIDKVSMDRILTYEEIIRIAEAAVSIGITKFKVTGGEPLVRLGCPELVRKLKAVSGAEQVTLTTNGIELARYMDELAEAGLDAVNISLDTLDPERFSYITQCGDHSKVMAGIDAAIESGVRTKINCVPQKGFNEDEIGDLARLAFERGIDVRFIELMPVGAGDAGKGVSNEYVLDMLRRIYPDLEIDKNIHGNGPAVYYHIPGRSGSIGLISAMHGVFCERCNRLRLTSQGTIKPCLCYNETVDLKPALKGTAEDLKDKLIEAISIKPRQHCFNDEPEKVEKRQMSQIGG